MHGGTRFPGFAFGSIRLRDGCSDQIPDTGSVQIRHARNSDVADEFAFTAQKSMRIGKGRPEVEAEVHPIGVSGGKDKRVARPIREREVVGDGIYLVNELASFWSLFEDQFSRGQRELLNRFSVRLEELDVLPIG